MNSPFFQKKTAGPPVGSPVLRFIRWNSFATGFWEHLSRKQPCFPWKSTICWFVRYRVEGKGENTVLILPHQLCASALLLLAGDGHKAVREIVEQIHESIENTLYLLGAAQAAGPARHMASLLKGTCADGHPELIERFLLAGYDYVYDRTGSLLLIHPGLAEPERMMGISNAEMNPEALKKASESINDLENPLYDRMLSLLADVTRPDISPEDAAEDLIILAKQEVPLSDMLEVLSSQLICRPTPEMRAALRELSERIPRWLGLSTSRVQ